MRLASGGKRQQSINRQKLRKLRNIAIRRIVKIERNAGASMVCEELRGDYALRDTKGRDTPRSLKAASLPSLRLSASSDMTLGA